MMVNFELVHLDGVEAYKCSKCADFYTFHVEDIKAHMRRGWHNRRVVEEPKPKRKRVNMREKIYNY